MTSVLPQPYSANAL